MIGKFAGTLRHLHLPKANLNPFSPNANLSSPNLHLFLLNTNLHLLNPQPSSPNLPLPNANLNPLLLNTNLHLLNPQPSSPNLPLPNANLSSPNLHLFLLKANPLSLNRQPSSPNSFSPESAPKEEILNEKNKEKLEEKKEEEKNPFSPEGGDPFREKPASVVRIKRKFSPIKPINPIKIDLHVREIKIKKWIDKNAISYKIVQLFSKTIGSPLKSLYSKIESKILKAVFINQLWNVAKICFPLINLI